MPSRVLDFPVFDADNHMYETPDAFTQFLPPEFEGLIQYVQVKGRTKIAVKGLISDYIPNPTFDVVAAPGAEEEYFKVGNPEGKSRREIMGKGIRALPGFRDPEPRLELMNELGLDGALMLADPGQPAGRAAPRRPGRHARRHPCAQPVDERALVLQLCEPDLPDAGDHDAASSSGHRGARMGPRDGAPGSS